MSFGAIFGLCAVVLLFVIIFNAKRQEKNTIASIPEEFKYIYLSMANFIAIDPRNKKMLLALDGTREMYDFADIQGHERDTHEEVKGRKRVKTTNIMGKRKYKAKAVKGTVHDLILYVNDKVNPAWEFSGNKDEMDCAELLVSRALDGTLPGTDERKIFNTWNAKDCESFLSTGTGAQG